MREERIAEHFRLLAWITADVTQARPIVREILALPSSTRDQWLASHPSARTVGVLGGLVDAAERDPASAVALTELVIRHLDLVPAPAESTLALIFLHGRAWSGRGAALRDAGDLHGALDAYEKAAEAYRPAPVRLPELEAVQRAAAELRSRIEGRRGPLSALLRDTPYAEWPRLAEREELRNEAAVEALCREAEWRANRAPLETLALADLATGIADSLESPEAPENAARLRAKAWKSRGLALRHLARYENALPAFDRAEELLHPFEALARDRAIVRFARATTLLEMGRLQEAIALLAESRSVFEKHADTRNQVLTGMAEGTLLWRLGRYQEAWETLHTLLPVARRLNDKQALAGLHNNLGYALIELEDFRAAEEHLEQAITLSSELGEPVQAARSQLARGRLMVRTGDVERGLSHLHSVREQFLTQNLVEEAGVCGLEIVEAHLWRGALIEAEAFARQMVREFTAAQLSKRAVTALRYLSEAIAARKASAATVEQVRDVILTLRQDPEAELPVSA